MIDWKDDKNLGPWAFEKQGSKLGYVNNPRWTGIPTVKHEPCGYWPDMGAYVEIEVKITGTPTVSKKWKRVAISSNGKYQTAVAQTSISPNSDYIYVSSDYGCNWTQKDILRIWTKRGVAMSSDGRCQTAVAGTKEVFVSSDYGVTWTIKNGLTNNSNGVIMSSNGQIQMVAETLNYFYVSTDYGQNWVERSTGSGSVAHSAISPNGNLQIMQGIDSEYWESNDYGVTWTAKTPWINGGATPSIANDNTRIAINSNAPDGKLYVDWVEKITPDATSSKWIAVAVAKANSQYMSAVCGNLNDTIYGTIWVSSDGGATWISKNGLDKKWVHIVISDDGRYQVAAEIRNDSKKIWYSHNYGDTWEVSNSPSLTWGGNLTEEGGIVMSSNGMYLTAWCIETSTLYFSSDYGKTWSAIPSRIEVITSNKYMQEGVNPVWPMPA